MSPRIAGFLWALLYFTLVLSPLVLMLLPPTPAPRSFFTELSSAIGFISLMQIGLQFVLIARFRPLTEPYGIDIILQYHRQIGIASLVLVVGHAAIAIGARMPTFRWPHEQLADGPGLISGLAATGAFVVLVALSVGRHRFRLSYEAWRVGHALLGGAMLVLAVVHAAEAGTYTNATWKRLFWASFASLMLAVLAYLRVIKPELQKARPYRVVSVEPDRGRTWILGVEPDGHDGMRFLPGQFVWLKLGASAHTLQEHPFSFSSSAEVAGRLEFGIKELGDFTSAIGDTSTGTQAYLDGPHGSMSIDRHPAAAYVFIAGGIGVTPIVSMLRTMADRGDRRPALLVYADGAWSDMPFRDDIEALQQRMALDVVYVLEDPPAEWRGESGWVTRELLEKHLPDEPTTRDFFVCGPNPMIDSVEALLMDLGIASRFIHAERFTLV